MDRQLGVIVRSVAGRDKGELFVIVAKEDDDYLLLADGKRRRIEKAKKKKMKHVVFTDICIEDIRTKLQKHDKITNAELRRAIKVLQIADMTE